MNHAKNVFISLVSGIVLAMLGVYFTGFTASFAMPSSLANMMWAWDIFVVQFLGFGVLAIMLSYLVAYLSKLSFVYSVLAIFVIAQFVLFLITGNLFSIYIANILTMFTCLTLGWFVACKKFD